MPTLDEKEPDLLVDLLLTRHFKRLVTRSENFWCSESKFWPAWYKTLPARVVGTRPGTHMASTNEENRDKHTSQVAWFSEDDVMIGAASGAAIGVLAGLVLRKPIGPVRRPQSVRRTRNGQRASHTALHRALMCFISHDRIGPATVCAVTETL